jgi:hypothetical protein
VFTLVGHRAGLDARAKCIGATTHRPTVRMRNVEGIIEARAGMSPVLGSRGPKSATGRKMRGPLGSSANVRAAGAVGRLCTTSYRAGEVDLIIVSVPS